MAAVSVKIAAAAVLARRVTANHVQVLHRAVRIAVNRLSNLLYPMDFKPQLGDKLAHPQEFTIVNDWGGQVQVTTLRLERRRVFS
jgi:hypothetical protein